LRNNPSWFSTPVAETTDKTNPMTANGKDIIQGFRDIIEKLPSPQKMRNAHPSEKSVKKMNKICNYTFSALTFL